MMEVGDENTWFTECLPSINLTYSFMESAKKAKLTIKKMSVLTPSKHLFKNMKSYKQENTFMDLHYLQHSATVQYLYVKRHIHN